MIHRFKIQRIFLYNKDQNHLVHGKCVKLGMYTAPLSASETLF